MQYKAPTVDIFIKTYPGDYAWLSYCLRSLVKFAHGFRQIVVVSDEKEALPLPTQSVDSPLPIVVHTTTLPTPHEFPADAWWRRCPGIGYAHQMVVKLHWTRYSDADYAFMVDSDTVLSKTLHCSQLFGADHRPMWLYSKFTETGPGIAWKPGVDLFFGRSIPFETMRQQGFTVSRGLVESLQQFAQQRHGMSLERYMLTSPLSICEYVILGVWAMFRRPGTLDLAESDEDLPPGHNNGEYQMIYLPRDTDPAPMNNVSVRQFWSWGGMSDEHRMEIERILMETPARQPTIATVTQIAAPTQSIDLQFSAENVRVQVEHLSHSTGSSSDADVVLRRIDNPVQVQAESEDEDSHNFELQPWEWNLYNLARSSSCILQVGLSGGYESLLFLMASERQTSRLVVFEEQTNPRNRRCIEHLQKTFGTHRLEVIFGNPTVAVPAYSKTHPQTNFDLFYIGAGRTPTNAQEAFGHCCNICQAGKSVVVLDGTRDPSIECLWQMWLSAKLVVRTSVISRSSAEFPYESGLLAFAHTAPVNTPKKFEIPLGIGDLLITRMVIDQHRLSAATQHVQLVINWEVVSKWRNGSSNYEQFVRLLTARLFPTALVEIEFIRRAPINSTPLFETWPLIRDPSASLSSVFDLRPIPELDGHPYVVIHTKCRLDRYSVDAGAVRRFFTQQLTLPTDTKLVLLGERSVGVNAENVIHGTQVFYQELMELRNKFNLIDSTADGDCNNAPEIEFFLRDLRIIHNSRLTIVLGLGGNMVMTTAVTDKFAVFRGELEYPEYPYLRCLPSQKLHSTLDGLSQYVKRCLACAN